MAENLSVDDTSPQPTKRRRKNATRACDSCKSKKARCDGLLPCSRCASQQSECRYDTPYLRGLAPPAVPTILTAPRQPSPSIITSSDSQRPSNSTPVQQEKSSPSHRSSETGRSVEENLSSADTEGVLGVSSNLEYSRAAQLQLRSQPPSPPPTSTHSSRHADGQPQAAPTTRPTNPRSSLDFSEPPLPPLDLSRYSLPTTRHGQLMMNWYFENASPTYRVLHRPTMERMTIDMCKHSEWLGGPGKLSDSSPLGRDEQSLVLLAWSLGCQFPLSYIGKQLELSEKNWLQQRGEDYYQVATLLIEEGKKPVDKLSILQARLLMCLYLLTTSRLKGAWDMFAIVKNMANNLDLTKSEDRAWNDSARETSALHSELRRRAFWSIYMLDSYLATMLGKSVTFDEKLIRVGYPLMLDDVQLGERESSKETNIWGDDKPPVMLGPIAHIKLSRIVRRTLAGLYNDQDLQTQIVNAEALLKDMVEWEAELPEHLKERPYGSLLNIYARQSSVMQLAKQHTLILICRPFLPLSGLVATPTLDTNDESMKTTQLQDRCLDAALHTCRLVMPLSRKEHIGGNFWFSSYVVFCAATVLLVYIAHHIYTSRREEIMEAAEKCLEAEKKIALSNPLARRYVAAIEGLRAQVIKRTGGLTSREQTANIASSSRHSESQAPVVSDSQGLTSATHLDGSVGVMSEWDGTSEDLFPQSLLEQMIAGTNGNSSFFDLDSLVTGGMDFGWR